jgi:hypothetical protein
MKKLLLLTLGATLVFGGSAQAGMLNVDRFNDWKGYVDNMKDADNYQVGTYVDQGERSAQEYYGLRLYDWIGTEEVPQPEGENLKIYIPYVSLVAGYARPHVAVIGMSTHVDELIRHMVRQTPGIGSLGINIPRKFRVGLGYGASYDFDEIDKGDHDTFEKEAFSYGFIATGSLNFKF